MEDCCLGFAAVISRPFIQFALYSSLIWEELDDYSHVPERQLVTRICERPLVFFLQGPFMRKDAVMWPNREVLLEPW
jgi:hypothetical protein